jgi:protein-S-isoprenylcysteine O-methyltransferase Ste14
MNLLDRYLLAKPVTRMLVEWPIMIGTGIIGMVFSLQRIPFCPISNIIGGLILLGSWAFHAQCHKSHRQAHQQSGKIESLVTTGIYSRIRHPMYTSLILMYLGFSLAWGLVLILIPVFLFSLLAILTALKEEEFLIIKFGDEYKYYMRKVPYRFIPKII